MKKHFKGVVLNCFNGKHNEVGEFVMTNGLILGL